MATDQEIRDRGIKFLPLQKYLQNPYEFPVEEEAAPVNQGIVNTNAFTGGGGDNFSVYNPDPNSIVNRDYRPNYDYRQFSEYGSDPSTADIKQMDINQNYFYGPPPSKLQGLLSMVPGAGIARFLGNQIGPYLPTNRRAIFENELAGQGVRVNDIGQIVQGGGAYDDASGRNVMAGYNANKMTADTYKKRRDMINETIDRKLKADPTYDRSYLDNRLTALDASQESILGTATDRANIIYADEEEEKNKNKKNTIVNRYITKKKETKAAEDAKAVEDAKAAQGVVDVEAVKAAIEKTKSEGFGTTSEGNYINQFSGGDPGNTTTSSAPSYTAADTNRESQRGQQTSAPTRSAPSRQSRHTSDPGGLHSYNKGGRIGYFFGGLAARRMKR